LQTYIKVMNLMQFQQTIFRQLSKCKKLFLSPHPKISMGLKLRIYVARSILN
jgi:hypothetical protein